MVHIFVYPLKASIQVLHNGRHWRCPYHSRVPSQANRVNEYELLVCSSMSNKGKFGWSRRGPAFKRSRLPLGEDTRAFPDRPPSR